MGVSIRKPLYIFIVLQIMDFATTLAALAMGGSEQNPLIAHMLKIGTVEGLLISKLIVIGLAAIGARLQKQNGLRLANLAFSGIVAWNLTIIGRLALQHWIA